MKCVVLQTADGGHLGFMLCTPGLDQPSGDCVFMPLPARPDLFDTPPAELLFARRQAGESAWQVTAREPLPPSCSSSWTTRARVNGASAVG